MHRSPLVLLLALPLALAGCRSSDDDDDSTTVIEPPPPGPTTAELLDAFYAANGGRDAFPDTRANALEALLYAQDELTAGDRGAARARVDAIFEAMPMSTGVWWQDSGFGGLNIGEPVAYYGLRMLDLILDLPDPGTTGTLQMTAVVAPCASVTRPTLPDHVPETVDLDIAPEILADDARVLRVSTDLFRAWVKAITNGLEIELIVHTMSECTTVDYTDADGVVISYPDAQAMVASVPSSVARSTDFWWVVAPSGVPGDGSGYDRHFITGGMGVTGPGLPLFLSDDGWFVRKPEHLGSGPYSEIELRAYQPQWFQHEFMHHLYRTWPAFGLEDEGHQWFDRSTWPADFVGEWEPDYYTESLTKRLLDATPSLADGLSALELLDPTMLDVDSFAGDYRRLPVENDWHEVTLTVSDDSLRWTNAAGVSWGLEVRDGGLWTEDDCPYGVSELDVEGADGAVEALWFGGERYGRTP